MASIDERMAALEARVMRLESKPAAAPPTATVDAGDLQSEYGNFVVKKDPPRWKGQSYAGKRLSECEPDYLESLAGLCDWKAAKDAENPEKAKYADYARKDAARARGWAALLRGGWKPAPAANGSAWQNAQASDADDSIPF